MFGVSKKCDDHVGKSTFPVKHFHHGLLVDFQSQSKSVIAVAEHSN
jgi:hypothetical protein